MTELGATQPDDTPIDSLALANAALARSLSHSSVCSDGFVHVENYFLDAHMFRLFSHQ